MERNGKAGEGSNGAVDLLDGAEARRADTVGPLNLGSTALPKHSASEVTYKCRLAEPMTVKLPQVGYALTWQDPGIMRAAEHSAAEQAGTVNCTVGLRTGNEFQQLWLETRIRK